MSKVREARLRRALLGPRFARPWSFYIFLLICFIDH
jgi:hypothetical protein